MRLPGGKVTCAGPPPGGGGEPTPVNRVSSEAPKRAVKRVLSSPVSRSSLMRAIQVPRPAIRAQWPRRAPIRVLPPGQCKERDARGGEAPSAWVQREDPVAAEQTVLISLSSQT